MGKGGLRCAFKGASAEILWAGRPEMHIEGRRGGKLDRQGGLRCIRTPRRRFITYKQGGREVRVGFGTTARHSRVAFAWVPARPHVLAGGCAFCCFTFIV